MRPRADLAAAALLLVLGAGALVRLWAGPGLPASPRSDLAAMGVGLVSLERRAFAAEGRIPAWNPSENSGQPAQADPAAEFEAPLRWLGLVLPPGRALALMILLNVLLSGLAMYACARRYLERPAAAFFCGAAYMLSWRALALIDAGWLGPLETYALTPLLVLLFDRLLERPSPGRTAALALAAGLAALQGFPQTLYFAGWGLAALLVWRLSRSEPRTRVRALLAVAAAAALALLIAAPGLLPRLQFAALSTRAARDPSFLSAGAPRWTDLKTLFAPFDAGGARLEYWENNFYFGLWLLPLWAVALARERRRAAILLALVAAAVLLSFDTPLLGLAYRFAPGWALFRRSSRLLLPAQAAAVLLAGLGVDVLLRARRSRRELAAAALLLLPTLADSCARMLPRLRSVPLAALVPPAPFPALTARSPSNGRTAAIGRGALAYGQAAAVGVDLVNAYSPMNLRDYAEYLEVLRSGAAAPGGPRAAVWTDLLSIARPDLLRGLDAQTLLSDRPLPLARIGWAPAGREDAAPVFRFYRGVVPGPVYAWRDRSPLGPAFFARSLRPVADEAASLRALASGPILDPPVLGWGGGGGQRLDFAGGTARLTRLGYDRYAYDVDSRGTNFLVLSQVWYPGWRARLDGRPARLYRAGHALLGLVVPPGRHALLLRMTSPARNWGLALAALGLALTGALAGLGRARRTA
ncbi:MAG: YfhO family protein [Elusimicrobia bacterium]|nr:YfhO family protein [Elusimicrobiota bacterium]